MNIMYFRNSENQHVLQVIALLDPQFEVDCPAPFLS